MCFNPQRAVEAIPTLFFVPKSHFLTRFNPQRAVKAIPTVTVSIQFAGSAGFNPQRAVEAIPTEYTFSDLQRLSKFQSPTGCRGHSDIGTPDEMIQFILVSIPNGL